jgi:prepilin-type N-terminal cleavage/methylation domain-containing protein/prepilin-type processing-associated H-X9-DG protein
MDRTSRRARGFTLIELLVVIAIIAILAAILFPVFAQARDKARSASCLSNLKQIGTALYMYAQDYDEGLPAWSSYFVCTTNGGTNCGADTVDRYWDAVLLPYVKSGNPVLSDRGGVWHCPSAVGGNSVRSYGYSQALMWSFTTTPQVYRFPQMAMLDQPASTIFVGDGGLGARLAVPWFYQGWYERNVSKVEPTREHPYRHSEGANYVFTDSHAKWLRWEEVYPTPDDGKTLAAGKLAYGACAKWHAATAGERDWCKARS